MALRKHGAETFPDEMEINLEIAAMEGLSDQVSDSVYGIIGEDAIIV